MIKFFVYSLLLFYLFGFSKHILSQTKDEAIQQRIELLAENLATEDISLEDVFDALYYYYDHPLNVNEANAEELNELHLLSQLQINELLLTRKEKGEFQTIYELVELSLWTPLTLDQVAPFIRVEIKEKEESQKNTLKKQLKGGKTETFIRWGKGIEEKKGYREVSDSIKAQDNSYYWGSPDRLYTRLRYQKGRGFSTGVTLEKDPGEEIGGKTQPQIVDFYSAHLFYQSEQGFLKTLAVGDYQLEIGQGLALWTGYAFNKTNSATTVFRKARGIRPYTSSDEQRYLRGVAAEFGSEKLQLIGWFSQKRIAGTVQLPDTLSSEATFYASSINATGLHRTTNELNRKKSLIEQNFGTKLKINWNQFNLGLSLVHFNLSLPILPDNRLLNQYAFRGDKLTNITVDYTYKNDNLLIFGEVAQSLNTNAFAFLNGLTYALNKHFSLALVHRNYAKDYHSFYSRGFAEHGGTNNELGTYFGIQTKLSDKWKLNTYVDVFKRDWLSFRVDSPSNGQEYFSQLNYRPNKKIQVDLRYRFQKKMINVTDNNTNMRPTEQVDHQLVRADFRYNPSSRIQWNLRMDWVTDNRDSKGERVGVNLAQNLTYSFSKQVKATAGYAVYNTDGFDTRIYVYEYHLQNVFSIPVYFNQGSRLYGMIRYSFLNNKAVIWLRYGAFFYANQSTISSGAEMIAGNKKSEFAVQLRLRL